MPTSDVIYPEMNQTTNAEIEFTCSYSGKYYVTTDLELKGRGIEKRGNGEDHKRGKKTYLATEKAMEKLKKSFNTCYIAAL